MDLFKEFGVKDPEAAAAQIPVIDFGPLFAGEPGALGRLAPQVRRRLRECRVLLRGRPRRARGADRRAPSPPRAGFTRCRSRKN